jgi:assimilatory nitrate reductase catalytic subunit
LKPEATTTLVCGFCSTGCALRAHLRGGEAVNLSPAVEYPVNLGMACPKGWESLTPLKAADRATVPLYRRARSERLAPIDWESAAELFVSRIREVQERHGPDSVAWLGTGQIPSEELALLGAVAKFGLGIVHGDGNTRQCMATAVTAYKQSFGFDAPPYTYRDFEESDVLVFVGSNLCISHPILWERVVKNRRRPEIIVVDPRRTETAMAATWHIPVRPKADLAFFYGVARALIERGALDRSFIDAHTEGFDAFAEHVSSFSEEGVAEATGLPLGTEKRLADTIARAERVSFWWTMGVNQSHEGVRVAQSLINLALMTGNIGRPGTGANSITGQCNAMGSRLFSNTASLYCGRDFENAEHRAAVARILDIDVARIPDRDSWAYDQIIEGIFAGKIRALWIVATNTAHSWINQEDAVEALRRLDFLVVQDLYATTETARMADLVLPAAGWGEKDGTFINSERRIGLIHRVARAPGEALADFYIFKLIAEAAGVGQEFARWSTPEQSFEILKELSRGRPCDITGIAGYDALRESRGVQWPLPEGVDVAPASERRLFEGGRFYTPDGRARFCFEAPRPVPELPDKRYPFLLLTGRGSSAQWHTETRTGKSATLRKLHPNDPYVEVSPADAARYGIRPGEWIFVESRRGRIRVRAHLTPVVQPGQVFVPMHDAQTNRLTFSAVDPYSRQPAYKACAVRLLKDNEMPAR